MISLFRGKPVAFVRHLNDLVKAVNALSHLVGDGLIKVQKTQLGTTIKLDVEQLISRIPRTGGRTGTTVRRAKIQAGGVGTTTLTCKLLNSSGVETGSNITVYPIEHLGTNSLSGDVWPDLAAADIVSIFYDLDSKYYTTFVFDDCVDCGA